VLGLKSTADSQVEQLPEPHKCRNSQRSYWCLEFPRQNQLLAASRPQTARRPKVRGITCCNNDNWIKLGPLENCCLNSATKSNNTLCAARMFPRDKLPLKSRAYDKELGTTVYPAYRRRASLKQACLPTPQEFQISLFIKPVVTPELTTKPEPHIVLSHLQTHGPRCRRHSSVWTQ